MGFVRKFHKFTLYSIAAANILVIAALCLTGYAGYVDPTVHPTFEVLTLAFPLPLLLNLAFLLFWLVAHYKFAWIPIAGFLICASPVRNYCPLNFSKEAPGDGFKVMSFNANIFHYNHDIAKLPNPAVDYLYDSGADIICLQEATMQKNQKELLGKLQQLYPYYEYEKHHTHERIAVLSKYPIVKHEQIPLDIKKNLCGAFYIEMGSDTLLVVNCHFESTGLSAKERDEFGDLVSRRGNSIDEHSFVNKLRHMGRRHAKQARDVMKYIKKHKTQSMSVVVCGDFNDSPLSYSHNVFTKEFVDCHTATANGPGFTHRAHGMLVRIDQIICSPDLEPFECKVDSKVQISDHYPISCTLKKRQKPKK